MLENLSLREREIFDLLLEGVPPKEIAYKLSITHSTVDFHRTKLYGKLGVHSIRELFAKYSTFLQGYGKSLLQIFDFEIY